MSVAICCWQLAALPLAAALPKLSGIDLPAKTLSVAEAIAWLYLIGFRPPHAPQVASRHD